jgi:hypothetical protein
LRRHISRRARWPLTDCRPGTRIFDFLLHIAHCECVSVDNFSHVQSSKNGRPSVDLRGAFRQVKLAHEIATRTKPRFIEIKPELRTKLRRTNDWLFIEIRRGGGKVPFPLTLVRAGREPVSSVDVEFERGPKW